MECALSRDHIDLEVPATEGRPLRGSRPYTVAVIGGVDRMTEWNLCPKGTFARSSWFLYSEPKPDEPTYMLITVACGGFRQCM